MIIPAQVPSTGVPERTSSRSGSASPSRSMPSVIVVDSPPGMISPSRPVEVGGHAHLARLRAELAQHARVRLEVALEREDADERRAHQPRLARSCCSSSLRDSSDVIAWPSPSLAAATRSASL